MEQRSLDGGGELRYEPRFLDVRRHDELFAWLLREVPWQQRDVVVFGRRHPQPRLVHWIAEFDYTYSRLTLPAAPWPEPVHVLRDEVERAVLGHAAGRFDGVLLNHYRDGADCVGYHSDDEAVIVPGSEIATVSFGARRRFVLQSRGERAAPRVELWLDPGSLLVMAGSTQRHWRHALPRDKAVVEPRISLTFRQHRPRS